MDDDVRPRVCPACQSPVPCGVIVFQGDD